MLPAARRAASQAGGKKSASLPRWDLSPVYQGFESRDYAAAKKRLQSLSGELLGFLKSIPQEGFAAWLKRAIEYDNEVGSLAETLMAYAYASYSTATRDQKALAELNALEEMALPLKKAAVLFRNAISSRRADVEALIGSDAEIGKFAFYLREELYLQSKQMAPELEDLAADLQRSGGDAWTRLQESVSSNTSADWDEKKRERKTVIQLRTMAFDENRQIREKAFRKEVQAWKSVEIPLASALNGVKGWTVAMNKHRGWEGAIEKSVYQARMTKRTLDALIGVMEEALPMFRRYLKAKAKLLKLPKLAFFDLFAPVGSSNRRFTFEETKDFIVQKFSAFSEELGAFAAKAFAERWIDAEPREGKVGGAYCIDFPEARASRILCNFEGSFSSLTTVAHELGHGYHHEVIKDLPYVQTHYPMTLAETASIFAETIVFEEALKSCEDSEKLSLLELHLQDGCQIIVDILSRFYFEREVFEVRKSRELGSEEFCEMMTNAQKKTYGDGLDEANLHPYMWAVKSHYYSSDLSYYNFPYAFGQLFGLGLYAKFKAEGPGFAKVYRDLLRETGRASAVEITAKAGFDIETKDFWRQGIAIFERQVVEFERLAEEFAAKKPASKKSASKPKSGAKPSGKAVPHAVSKAASKPAAKPAQAKLASAKPGTNSAAKASKPTAKPAAKPATKPAAKPAAKPAGKPAKKVTVRLTQATASDKKTKAKPQGKAAAKTAGKKPRK
jgi:pepF/M3 family oligoendopeptidase